jgi:spore germination protein
MLMAVLMSGCMNIDKKVLDDIQLGTAAGYEYMEDDETIEMTVVYPNFQPDKSVKSETLVASSILSKEIRDKLTLQSDKPLVSGKVEVTLYERRVAEKGIFDLLDTLQRDPSIGTNVYLSVVEGSPKEVLSKQYGNLDNGIYLSNLIEQNIENGLIHKTNLHQFLYKLYADGIDPMLPILEQKGGKIHIKAIGLFDDDKLVDQIEEDEFFFLKILLERKGQKDSYALQYKEDKKASIVNINSKRKYDIPKPMTSSEIKINVKLKSTIREYSNGPLNIQNIKELEKVMVEEIETKTQDMIQRFQELGIDPLGIGEEVRTRTRKWDQKKWEDLYPNIKITVSVNVKILESGVVK